MRVTGTELVYTMGLPNMPGRVQLTEIRCKIPNNVNVCLGLALESEYACEKQSDNYQNMRIVLAVPKRNF